MTIAEANNFYEQDEKKYEIASNKDFLEWLENAVKNGYHFYNKIDELQQLVDRIANWYEIKYPERELEYYEGTRYIGMQYNKRMSNIMDIGQLLLRLSDNQISLIECWYRSKCYGQILQKIFVAITIHKKNRHRMLPNDFFIINADHRTGELQCNIGCFIDSYDGLLLDELLTLLHENYEDKFDFQELIECVNDHCYDMELRNRILQFVALKLLYSRNTIPERGYARAKRFINEFNKKLGLNLSTEEMDKIMSADYSNYAYKEKGKQKLLRKGQ